MVYLDPCIGQACIGRMLVIVRTILLNLSLSVRFLNILRSNCSLIAFSLKPVSIRTFSNWKRRFFIPTSRVYIMPSLYLLAARVDAFQLKSSACNGGVRPYVLERKRVVGQARVSFRLYSVVSCCWQAVRGFVLMSFRSMYGHGCFGVGACLCFCGVLHLCG